MNKIEKKIKKGALLEVESNLENKINMLENQVIEVSKNQLEENKTIEHKLNFKADREVIQQLLKEQAKINEFICAENVVARYKVIVLNYFKPKTHKI